MTLIVRKAIAGYEYKPDEPIEFVVDPFWEQRGTVRMIQKGLFRGHLPPGDVYIAPLGEPWPEPKPTKGCCEVPAQQKE